MKLNITFLTKDGFPRCFKLTMDVLLFLRSHSSQWRIRAGSSFHNAGGQVIQVSSFYELEGYNNVNLANDLVILRLSKQITLGSSAATVTLPAQGISVVDGAMGIVTGWGRLYVRIFIEYSKITKSNCLLHY